MENTDPPQDKSALPPKGWPAIEDYMLSHDEEWIDDFADDIDTMLVFVSILLRLSVASVDTEIHRQVSFLLSSPHLLPCPSRPSNPIIPKLQFNSSPSSSSAPEVSQDLTRP